LQVLWVRSDHLVDEVENFQRVAKAIVGDLVVGPDVKADEVWARRPDGPEGAAEVAGAETGNVDVAGDMGG